MAKQRTISKSVQSIGIGLHSGKNVKMKLRSAEEFTGIVFHRTDVTPGSGAINVCAAAVCESDLCTVISNEHGTKVGTVEHLMASFYALGIDNVIVEIDAAEVPVFDGSAKAIIELLDEAGVQEQQEERKVIKILKEVTVKEGNCALSVKPSSEFSLKVFVEYGYQIPPQNQTYAGDEIEFRSKLALARTFCFEKDVEQMQSMGMAQGGSLDNAVVFGDDGVLNEEGLRFKDEPLRHKALDALGDLYISGYRIIGAFNLTRPGHEMNNRLLRAILENKENWKWA